MTGVLAFAIAGLLLGALTDLYLERSYGDIPRWGRPRRCWRCDRREEAIVFLPLVAFLAWRGRCPGCGQPLPWRALFLPLATAALFIAARLTAESWSEAILKALFGTIFLALLVTDMERRLIPNRIVYPAMVLALAVSWAWPDRGVLAALAGGVVLFLFMLVFYIVSRGGMGAGDVKMAALMGLAAGLHAGLAGIMVTALAGGIAATILLITRRVRMGQAIPYGPFLALGGIVALLWGEELFDKYI